MPSLIVDCDAACERLPIGGIDGGLFKRGDPVEEAREVQGGGKHVADVPAAVSSDADAKEAARVEVRAAGAPATRSPATALRNSIDREGIH